MDALKLALSAGADPSSRDRYADTPLHTAIQQKDAETTALLLSSGADPFAPNYQGLSPIALVLAENSESSLRNFVGAAGLEAKDAMGEGFLHYAVRAGKADAVKVLLTMGANKTTRNNAGESAKDVATTKGMSAIQAMF